MEAMNKLVDCQTEESPLCYHKCAIVRAQPNFLKGCGSAGVYSGDCCGVHIISLLAENPYFYAKRKIDLRSPEKISPDFHK